jgi:hypothetical protein
MRLLGAAGAALCWALSSSAAVADDTNIAAGASLSLQQREDYASGSRTAAVPELVVLGYIDTAASRIYARPGLRIGFAGIDQAEMPQAIRMREYDIDAVAELGVLYDGVVTPSLAVGAGGVARWVTRELDAPINGSSSETRFELLPAVQAQVGLGVPLVRGGLVVEPFVRYDHVFGDDRVGWGVGFDATLAIR